MHLFWYGVAAGLIMLTLPSLIILGFVMRRAPDLTDKIARDRQTGSRRHD